MRIFDVDISEKSGKKNMEFSILKEDREKGIVQYVTKNPMLSRNL